MSRTLHSLWVVGPKQVALLTGSGKETVAHLLLPPRVTQPGGTEWDSAAGLFPALPGARRVYVLDVDLVQTSCGMAVPLMAFQAERGDLNRSFGAKTAAELHAYQQLKNARSIDGFSTALPE